MLKNKLTDKMGRHAQKEYPKEACGIITQNFDYIECKNISPNPKSHFILDPISIINHEDNIWGFFHSHPGSENPLPSEHDLASTVFNEFKFIVGFANKFYIYWSESGVLKYEELDESHLTHK